LARWFEGALRHQASLPQARPCALHRRPGSGSAGQEDPYHEERPRRRVHPSPFAPRLRTCSLLWRETKQILASAETCALSKFAAAWPPGECSARRSPCSASSDACAATTSPYRVWSHGPRILCETRALSSVKKYSYRPSIIDGRNATIVILVIARTCLSTGV
jgi:hypothetical protein